MTRAFKSKKAKKEKSEVRSHGVVRFQLLPSADLLSYVSFLHYRRELTAPAPAGLSAFASGPACFFSRPLVGRALGVGGTAAFAGDFTLFFL